MYRAEFGPCKKGLVTAVESKTFDNTITVIIILNSLAMCVDHYGQVSAMRLLCV